MRRIDHWAGLRLVRWYGFNHRSPKSLHGDHQVTVPPQRVVCSKFLGLGSVVLSLPLLQSLKSSGAKIAFWSFPAQAELVRLSGMADEIWVIEPTLTGFIPSLFKTLGKCRRFRAEAFLDLEPSAYFSALLAWKSRASIRIGFMSGKPAREKLFTHLVALTPERHMAEHGLNMARLLAVPIQGIQDLPAPPATPSRLPRSSRTRIVINVNASDLSWHRLWPDARWIDLSNQLLAETDAELLFAGDRHEAKRVAAIVTPLLSVQEARGRVFNLAGQTDLSELISLLRGADLVVSIDSGIMHLAAWAGAPVVGLFGPETPRLYAPLTQPGLSEILWAKLPCSPCLSAAADKVTSCRDNQCMKHISPNQVLVACRKLLGRRNKSTSAA